MSMFVRTATAALAQSDASNRAAHRDLAVLDVVRGRSAVLAGDPAQARRTRVM
mgnify:CR=1 FL=1